MNEQTEEALIARLDIIERQNLQILDLLMKLADSRHADLPSASGLAIGKYTPEQWAAIVRDPSILRELSRQDTRKRRKNAMAARINSGDRRGKQNRVDPGCEVKEW